MHFQPYTPTVVALYHLPHDNYHNFHSRNKMAILARALTTIGALLLAHAYVPPPFSLSHPTVTPLSLHTLIATRSIPSNIAPAATPPTNTPPSRPSRPPHPHHPSLHPPPPTHHHPPPRQIHHSLSTSRSKRSSPSY